MARKKPKNWLDQRLTILTEVMNSDTEKSWTVRDIQEAMRAHPAIQEFQPNYGKSTAARDLAVINQEMSKRRKDLAEGYIVSQLNLTESLIDDLYEEYHSLDKPDNWVEPDKKARAKVALAKAINTLFVRQANILPIDIPKKIEIDNKHTFGLEDYLEIREIAGELDDPTVVEGDYDIVD